MEKKVVIEKRSNLYRRIVEGVAVGIGIGLGLTVIPVLVGLLQKLVMGVM